MCICSKIEIPVVSLFDDEELHRQMENIFVGITTTSNLDRDVYFKIARKLQEGVTDGYGKNIHETLYDSPDYNLLSDFRENVYRFSAAKVYQQTREIIALLNKSEFMSYADFKEKAIDVLKKHNEKYLSIEYQSAIAQSSSAARWQQMEQSADSMPMLTYHTVGDMRVRFSHALMDGVTKPITDPFWSKAYPPNDYNCRCTVLQSEDVERKNLPKGFKMDNHIPEEFQFNAAKERIIFSRKHPYFDVPNKDKDLKRDNFNLPLS